MQFLNDWPPYCRVAPVLAFDHNGLSLRASKDEISSFVSGTLDVPDLVSESPENFCAQFLELEAVQRIQTYVVALLHAALSVLHGVGAVNVNRTWDGLGAGLRQGQRQEGAEREAGEARGRDALMLDQHFIGPGKSRPA